MGPGPPRRHRSCTGRDRLRGRCPAGAPRDHAGRRGSGILQGSRQQLPQVGAVDGLLEAVQHGGVRLGEEQRIVRFPQLRPDGPGQPLPVEAEPRVDAGLVPSRVLPRPAPLPRQLERDQAVRGVQLLVAQRGRDAFGAQQRRQGVCFGEADAGALLQDVGGAPGDPRVPVVGAVRDRVADVRERRLGVCVCVRRRGAQPPSGVAHDGVLVVDHGAGGEVGGRVGLVLEQLHGSRR